MAWVSVNPRISIDDNRYVLDIFDCEILFFQQAFASLVEAFLPAGDRTLGILRISRMRHLLHS
jgi:hypothetical protein